MRDFTISDVLSFRPYDHGVAGLDDTIVRIFYQVFVPFAMPIDLLQRTKRKRPKGVLLYGEPGTGKSTILREIIEKFFHSIGIKDTIIKVNAADLFRKHLGESEQNVKEIFAPAIEHAKNVKENKASHQAPFPIFIDEFDSICIKRSNGSGGGDGVNATDRITSLFLQFIEGIDKDDSANIIIFGTTNRIDAIDPAMLRPGRMDYIVHIPLPSTQGRVELFYLMIEDVKHHVQLSDDDIRILAEETMGFTGADIKSVVHKAVDRTIDCAFKEIEEIQREYPTLQEQQMFAHQAVEESKHKLASSLALQAVQAGQADIALLQKERDIKTAIVLPLFKSGTTQQPQLVGIPWCPDASDFLTEKHKNAREWEKTIQMQYSAIVDQPHSTQSPLGRLTKENLDHYLSNMVSYVGVQPVRFGFTPSSFSSQQLKGNYRFSHIKADKSRFLQAIADHRRSHKFATTGFFPMELVPLCSNHEAVWNTMSNNLKLCAAQSMYRSFYSILLQAPRGSGRTCMVSSIISKLKKQFPMVYNYDIGDLTPYTTPENMLSQLRSFFTQLEHQTVPCVLLIDGVERLRKEHASIKHTIQAYMEGTRYNNHLVVQRLNHMIAVIVIGTDESDDYRSSADMTVDGSSLLLYDKTQLEHAVATIISADIYPALRHGQDAILSHYSANQEKFPVTIQQVIRSHP